MVLIGGYLIFNFRNILTFNIKQSRPDGAGSRHSRNDGETQKCLALSSSPAELAQDWFSSAGALCLVFY